MYFFLLVYIDDQYGSYVYILQSRKIQESGWKPRWFRREGENGTFRYVGGYWEAREHGRWDGCPNTFGEFNEDSTDPLGASS